MVVVVVVAVAVFSEEDGETDREQVENNGEPVARPSLASERAETRPKSARLFAVASKLGASDAASPGWMMGFITATIWYDHSPIDDIVKAHRRPT